MEAVHLGRFRNVGESDTMPFTAIELLRKFRKVFTISYQTPILHHLVLFGKMMATQPPAPNSLPQYLADGVPKQDDENLRALQDWIDELLTYRQEVAPEEINPDEGESIEAVEESSGGTIVIKKVTCGKDNCKCQRGELHGPYKYIVKRQGETLNWTYKGPVSE